MNLSAPQVTGPVSVCSDAVRVKGQLTGSTVSIILNGNVGAPVAEAPANWSSQVFQLTNLPPEGLQPGDELTAVQRVGADESNQSPVPALVQSFEPATLDHISFKTHLNECARHLWLEGLVPGARLEVGPGGSRGSSKSVDGSVRLSIDPGIGAGETLDVRQIACGETGPDVFGVEPDSKEQFTLPGGGLPAPTVGAPPHACDREVLVTNVVEGATVTLNRTGGASQTSGFDRDALWFGLHNDPLQEGEEITVSQAMPDCELNSQESPPVTVLPAEDVPTPGVAKPLCEGSTSVLVFGLTPGTKVRILADGSELVVGEAPDPVFAFSVPSLQTGTKITAQQERCDVWSAESAPVTVDAGPANVPVPQIAATPLHECATVVPVRNLQRGSVVRAFSTTLGQISPAVYVNTAEAMIPVSPALIEDDEVYVDQTGCGNTRVESTAVPVVASPALTLPRIVGPVTSRDTAVHVKDIVPGAVVEVYRRRPSNANLEFLKAVNPGVSETDVRLGELTVGHRLVARQILCNTATPLRREDEVEVQRPRPLPPVDLTPDGSLTERQPTLDWKDPKVGDPDWKADRFDLEITVDGSQTFSDDMTASSHVITSDLPFSADVDWRVRGKNPSGTSQWSEASFEVKPEPGPDGPSKLRIWNCTSDKRVLHIWLYDITGNSLTQKGTLNHHYENGGCPGSGATPLEISLSSGHSYQLIAVDPELGGCGVNDPTVSFCQRLITQVFPGDAGGPIMDIII